MRLSNKYNRVVSVFIFLSLVSAVVACTSSPSPTSVASLAPAQTSTSLSAVADSPTPTATLQPSPLPSSTPTAVPTPTPKPTVNLPVRLGAYPLPTIPLGASNNQKVVELARWGNGEINQIAVSPDKAVLAIASTAGIFFYDTKSYQPITNYHTPSSAIALQYAHDGSFLAVAIQDSILILQTNDYTLKHRFEANHPYTVGNLPFDISSDDKKLVITGETALQIWDIASGSQEREFSVDVSDKFGDSRGVAAVRFMNDEKLLVLFSGDRGGLQLIDLPSGQTEYATPSVKCDQWALSGNGQYAALQSGTSEDSTVFIFNAQNGEQLLAITPKARSHQIFFSPDGSLFGLNLGKTVCTWNFPDGTENSCLDRYDTSPTGFTADGKNLAFRNQQSLDIVNAQDGTTLNTIANVGRISKFLLTGQNKIYLFGNREAVTIWDENGVKLGEISGFRYDREYTSIAIVNPGMGLINMPAGQDALVLGNRYESVVFYDPASGVSLFESNRTPPIRQLLVSSDGKTAAYISHEELAVFDVEKNKSQQLAAIESVFDIPSIALSANGQTIAAISYNDKEIWLWDSATAQQTGVIALPDFLQYSSVLALSPDGQILAATGTGQAKLLVFDISSPAQPTQIAMLKELYVSSLTFTPDGSSLVLGEGRGRVMFLDTADWLTPRLTFDTGFYFHTIGFLNENALAIIGYDGLIHIWGVLPPSDDDSLTAESTSTPAAQVAAVSTPAALPGTPYPTPSTSFINATAHDVVELARWGNGIANTMLTSPDGQMVAVCTSTGISLHDAQTLAPIGKIETPGMLYGARFSADSKFLASLTREGVQVAISLWAIPENKFILQHSFAPAIWASPVDGDFPFDFSPDDQILAVLTDRDVTFYETRTGAISQNQPLPLDLKPSAVRYVAGGKSLILYGADGLRWLEIAAQKFTTSAPMSNASAFFSEQNGKYIAVGSRDWAAGNGSLNIYDAATGEPIGASLPFKSGVMALAISPSGNNLVASATDGQLCIWNLPGLELQQCLAQANDPITRKLRFTTDEKYLIASQNNLLRIWNTTDWSPMQDAPVSATFIRGFEVLPNNIDIIILDETGLARWKIGSTPSATWTLPGEAAALAFSADKMVLAAAGEWGVQTWDANNGKLLHTFPDPALALSFSGDGKILAAAQPDGTVALYTLPDGSPLQMLTGLQQPASQTHFLSESTILVAVNATETRLWNVENGELLPIPMNDPGNILAIVDGKDLERPGQWLGIDQNLTGRIWVVQTGNATLIDDSLKNTVRDVRAVRVVAGRMLVLGQDTLVSLDGYGYQSWAVPLNPAAKPMLSINNDGSLAAVSASDMVLIVNDKGEILRRFPGQTNAMSLTLDGTRVALSSGGNVQIWNTARLPDASFAEFEDSWDNRFDLVYVSEFQKLVETAPSQPVLLWGNGYAYKSFDPANGKFLANVNTGGTMGLAYSQDMSVEAFIDGTYKIGLIVADQSVRMLSNPASTTAQKISVSANGERLAAVLTTGTNQVIAIWDTSKNQPPSSTGIPAGFYAMTALSPDGNTLVVVSREHKLLVFDITQLMYPKLLATIEQQNGESVAFSPDGQICALGDTVGNITLFDMQNGWKPILSFKAHARSVQSLLFLPDGKIIASTGDDGTLRLWGVR